MPTHLSCHILISASILPFSPWQAFCYSYHQVWVHFSNERSCCTWNAHFLLVKQIQVSPLSGKSLDLFTWYERRTSIIWHYAGKHVCTVWPQKCCYNPFITIMASLIWRLCVLSLLLLDHLCFPENSETTIKKRNIDSHRCISCHLFETFVSQEHQKHSNIEVILKRGERSTQCIWLYSHEIQINTVFLVICLLRFFI